METVYPVVGSVLCDLRADPPGFDIEFTLQVRAAKLGVGPVAFADRGFRDSLAQGLIRNRGHLVLRGGADLTKLSYLVLRPAEPDVTQVSHSPFKFFVVIEREDRISQVLLVPVFERKLA